MYVRPAPPAARLRPWAADTRGGATGPGRWATRRLVLETGTAQPKRSRSYEREGYLPTDGFGHYADEPGAATTPRTS